MKGDAVSMKMVYQTDKRSGLTYAYENRRVWSEERQKYVNQRKLIGRVVNMETKEIAPTDGRGRKRSPYSTEEEKANLQVEEPSQFSSALCGADTKRNAIHNDQSSRTGALSTPDRTAQLTAAVEAIQKELKIIRNLLAEK